MASRVAMVKRLARLESAYAYERKQIARERLLAKFANWTRSERRARIVFLMRRRMQACGIAPTSDENLADAAVRTLFRLCPSVGHLAPTLKEIFEEAEGLPSSAATDADAYALVGEATADWRLNS
jgi:hypothetical protein